MSPRARGREVGGAGAPLAPHPVRRSRQLSSTTYAAARTSARNRIADKRPSLKNLCHPSVFADASAIFAAAAHLSPRPPGRPPSPRHPARSEAEMRDRRAEGGSGNAPERHQTTVPPRSRIFGLRPRPGRRQERLELMSAAAGTAGRETPLHACRGCQWLPALRLRAAGMTSEGRKRSHIPSAVTPGKRSASRGLFVPRAVAGAR